MVEKAELEALLYLLNTWVGPPFLRPWIEAYGSARATWRALRAQVSAERLAQAERFVPMGLRVIEELGVSIITIHDARYPERLKHLDDAAP
ncbi:MAG: hypothetical protein ACRENP_04615 [Longimicrobiales bacterium]